MNNKNLLMVAGIVEIEDDILNLGAEKLEYNRKPEYKSVLKNVFEGLQYVYQTKNPVLLVASSGTGVMEGAVCNVLSQGDKALYVNGGVFGERWGLICKQHKIETVEIKKDFGVPVTIDEIKQKLEEHSDIKAVLLTHNETSTGTLTDIKPIANLLKNYKDTILIVDCISSLLVEEIKTDEWGIDVVVSSGNKAMALPPGIGFMSYSDKALKKVKDSDNKLFNFDALEYIKEWEKYSTPYTPPISLVRQLERRLYKIKAEGLDNVRERYFENTKYLRAGIKTSGLNFFTESQANCVTGVIMPEGIDACEVVKILGEKYHIDVTPSWPELKHIMFRVCNFGNINKSEIDRFLTALNETMNEIKTLKGDK